MQILHRGHGINTAASPQEHWGYKAFCVGLCLGSEIKEQLFIAFIINAYHPGKKILAGLLLPSLLQSIHHLARC